MEPMTPNPVAQEAFAQHRRRVESVAARIVRDPEEAADIASEVFLALLEKGPVEPDAIPAWLVTSARNRALNRVRDRARAIRNFRRVDPVEQTDPAPADERIPALVRETLARLSERDRLALTLRYGAEAPNVAVAQRLGVTEAQARVVVHRAVQRMRAQAIGVLAERSGAPAACRTALTEAVSKAGAHHAGCAPCSTLMDEVAALGAPAVFAAPAVPLLQRVADRLGWTTLRARAPRLQGLDRAGEMVAAVVLATSLGAGAMPPATTSPDEQVAAPTALAAGSVVDDDGRVRDAGARARDAAGRIGDLIRIEDDDAGQRVAPEEIRLLGRSLRVPDVSGPFRPSHAALDIRVFEIGTVRGPDGEAAGLMARVKLGAAPLDNSALSMTWVFGDGRGSAGIAVEGLGASPTGAISMSDEDALLFPYEQNAPVEIDVAGPIVTITVAFADLSRAMAGRLRPGALLENISVGTSGGEDLVNSGDIAPDSGHAEYRIQR